MDSCPKTLSGTLQEKITDELSYTLHDKPQEILPDTVQDTDTIEEIFCETLPEKLPDDMSKNLHESLSHSVFYKPIN